MGDITMRLRRVTPRIVSGQSRSISGTSRSWSAPEGQPCVVPIASWSRASVAMSVPPLLTRWGLPVQHERDTGQVPAIIVGLASPRGQGGDKTTLNRTKHRLAGKGPQLVRVR